MFSGRRAIIPALLCLAIAGVGSLPVDRITEPRDRAEALPSNGPFWQLDPAALVPPWPQRSAELDAHVERLAAAMTPQEKVAQLLMVSWATEEPTPEIMRWIRERNIGGVKVFGWNGRNLPVLADAIAGMQRASLATDNAIPLFTATDQEGGWVRHIKGSTSITPGNMAIGASDLPFDALMSARYIGLELRALGINMNFAPTVDVYVNREAHVIGPRAFSDDPHRTALLGAAFFRGLEQAGVMATAKHFPGHGNAAGDSHGVLPVIDDPLEVLWARDILPFRVLIREGVPAVLSGHLSFPAVTGEAVPASISSYFKRELLRNRLGFEGIVITDDLYMGGATVYGARRGWSFARLVLEAILAGNDIIMLSRTPQFDGEIWSTLMDAWQTDETFRLRVEESVRRILRLKLAYLLPTWRVPLEPDAESLAAFMGSPQTREFFQDQAGRAVSVVGDELLPLASGSGTVLLAGRNPEFFRVGQRYFPGAREFRYEDFDFFRATPSDRQRFLVEARSADTIIFLLSDPATASILESATEFQQNLVVYSILTPIYLARTPWVRSAIAAYGWGLESFEAGFGVLTGRLPAPGSVPIRLEPGGG